MTKFIWLDMCPPTANSMYRHARGMNFLSRAAKEFYSYAAQRWTQRIDWTAVDVVIYIVPQRKNIDVDNRIKPTLDAITRAGVWKDDSIVSSVKCALIQPNRKLFPRGAVFIEISRRDSKYISFDDVSDEMKRFLNERNS